MKFSKLSQLVLVSTLGLLAASLLSGCLIVTVDYVFVANSSRHSTGTTGEIQTFAVDAESGAMRPVDTAVSSGGSSPVAMAVSGDYANLYVANQGNDTVVHFLVNADGSLTQKDSVTLTFKPSALAVNTAGSQSDPHRALCGWPKRGRYPGSRRTGRLSALLRRAWFPGLFQPPRLAGIHFGRHGGHRCDSPGQQ